MEQSTKEIYSPCVCRICLWSSVWELTADTCKQHTAGEGGNSLVHFLESHGQTSGKAVYVPSVRSFAGDKCEVPVQVLGDHGQPHQNPSGLSTPNAPAWPIHPLMPFLPSQHAAPCTARALSPSRSSALCLLPQACPKRGIEKGLSGCTEQQWNKGGNHIHRETELNSRRCFSMSAVTPLGSKTGEFAAC